MRDSAEPSAGGARQGRAPWHLWVVGLLVLGLYAGGAWDYLNLMEPRVSYIQDQGWGSEAVEYFTDYPLFPYAFWTLNIVTGLGGPLALLLRSRHAEGLALTATLALVVVMAVTFTFMDRWAALGPFTNLWDAGILLLTVAFWGYCRTMRRRSVLA